MDADRIQGGAASAEEGAKTPTRQDSRHAVIASLLGQLKVRRGLYVDAGSVHCVRNSLTYGLYRHGFKGVCFEPEVRDALAHARYRPRDVVVLGCAGEEFGLRVRPGVMSPRRKSIPKRARDIAVVPVSGVIDAHQLPMVHLLAIGTEAKAGEVLAGLDLERHRPWLVWIDGDEFFDTGHGAYWESGWHGALLAAGYHEMSVDPFNHVFVGREQYRWVGAVGVQGAGGGR